MTDLHTRLLAAVQQRMDVARAATPGPWRHNAAKMWIRPDAKVEEDFEEFVGAGPIGKSICVAATGQADAQSMADAEHIAANDPATVLRHCERDLKVLERHVDTGIEDPHEPGYCRGCNANFREEWAQQWPCAEILDLCSAYGVDQ